jgi:hypothetical protein
MTHFDPSHPKYTHICTHTSMSRLNSDLCDRSSQSDFTCHYVLGCFLEKQCRKGRSRIYTVCRNPFMGQSDDWVGPVKSTDQTVPKGHKRGLMINLVSPSYWFGQRNRDCAESTPVPHKRNTIDKNAFMLSKAEPQCLLWWQTWAARVIKWWRTLWAGKCLRGSALPKEIFG